MNMIWRPVHTAPKVHEEHILMWSKEYGLCSAYWVSEDLDLIDWDAPDWIITPVHSFDAYTGGEIFGDLTHWMPSPSDPTNLTN